MQFYTMFGRWLHKEHSKHCFTAQDYLSSSELGSLLPYLPQEEVTQAQLNQLNGAPVDVPRTIGGPLVIKMNGFFSEANEIYRVNAYKIDKAYEMMANDRHSSFVHLSEITRRVLDLPSKMDIPASTLWAVHRALSSHEIGFSMLSLKHHWHNSVWEVLPRTDVNVAKQMRIWMHEHQEYLMATQAGPRAPHISVFAEFGRRARAAILESRRHRAVTPHGGIGPSNIQEPATRESPIVPHDIKVSSMKSTDACILRFMELWCIHRHVQNSPLSTVGPMILKSTSMYDDLDYEIGIPTGWTFLQEMGVVAPWADPYLFSSYTALPGYQHETTDNLLNQSKRSVKNWKPIDAMKDMRRDWGDLEVFCIDGLSAKEIDDGISLEPIAGDNTCAWVHVHVANPSAFIQPSHPMAKYAAHQPVSVYLSEGMFPMLPSEVVQEHFTLASGRPTLTFSAKLNNDGEILDHRVTPGIIRNIIYTTPRHVHQNLVPTNGDEAQVLR